MSIRPIELFLCMVLVIAPPVAADTAKPAMDSRADVILRDMSDYLKKLREFSFRSEVSYDQVLEGGEKIQYAREAEVFMRRPSRLYAQVNGDLIDQRMWYDGKTFTLMNSRTLEFSKVDARDNLDDTLDFMAHTYGISSPVADLLYSDPYAILTENISTGTYIGESLVRGVRTHHLAFTQENIDWQIWVEVGAHPVPRKVVITYKNVASSPQFSSWLSDWKFAPVLADSLFRFFPPEGAHEVELEPVGK